MRKIFLLLILLITVPVFASEVVHNAGSVLVMDALTGEVIFETDGFSRRYPASTTKIMTALIVLENVENLSERITFSSYSVDLPEYAGRFGAEEGESMTVLEALYGLMLPSANDVARALAEHVAGSEAEFVAMMNRRASELGAHNTRFVNACGLPGDGQFITAYDIALIMQAAIKNPIFVQIISTPYFFLPPTNMHDEEREMRNSNSMVRPSRAEFNPHVIGGKTGFTNAAQHTLVSYATHEDREIIISVLFATPRSAIFSDTAALINFIFHGISNVPPPPPPEILPEEIETEEEIIEEEFFEEEFEEEEEEEIFDEIEIEETATVFTYEFEEHVPEDEITPEKTSNIEAIIIAFFSIIMTGASLYYIWLLYKL
jgi:D-alanyl-D-alanine carboxypeptidase